MMSYQPCRRLNVSRCTRNRWCQRKRCDPTDEQLAQRDKERDAIKAKRGTTSAKSQPGPMIRVLLPTTDPECVPNPRLPAHHCAAKMNPRRRDGRARPDQAPNDPRALPKPKMDTGPSSASRRWEVKRNTWQMHEDHRVKSRRGRQRITRKRLTRNRPLRRPVDDTGACRVRRQPP